MDTHHLLSFRQQKDEFFGTSQQSPIPPRDRKEWHGLNYFEPNEDLAFTLPVEPADGGELRVQTSDGRVRSYRRVGTVTFDVDGETVKLTLLGGDGSDSLFVPFRDATSGKETYGAGRYLDVHRNPDGTVTVDFNYAYNPYCAYDDAYSCPLPPPENWLPVPIRAGERGYR